MHEALIMVTSAPTFHTAFKNMACLSTRWAAACDQIYIWKHSAPARSLRDCLMKSTLTRYEVLALRIVINVFEFNFFFSLGLETNWAKSILSVISGNAFKMFCMSLSPRILCKLWVNRVGGWLAGAEPQGVCVKGSHVLFTLLCSGAFNILPAFQILQTIVREPLLSAIKNSLVAHTITLKIFNMQLRWTFGS